MIKQKTVRMVHARPCNYSWHNDSVKNLYGINKVKLNQHGKKAPPARLRIVFFTIFTESKIEKFG